MTNYSVDIPDYDGRREYEEAMEREAQRRMRNMNEEVKEAWGVFWSDEFNERTTRQSEVDTE